jgi:hypothetical protein
MGCWSFCAILMLVGFARRAAEHAFNTAVHRSLSSRLDHAWPCTQLPATRVCSPGNPPGIEAVGAAYFRPQGRLVDFTAQTRPSQWMQI